MIDLRIRELNEKAETANSGGSTEKKTSISESEWSGLRGELKGYGVTLEGAGKYGNFNNVLSNVNAGLNSGCMISVTNENGEEEQVELNQAIADSYDSVLDLVLKQKLEKVLGDGSWKIEDLSSAKNQAKLKEAGIEFKVLDHRIYTFSLVDDDGNVIQDEEGNLAQVIMTDKVLPDGYMQGTDKNWNAVLDYVGYNCVSELDYTKEEWAQIQELANLDNSELGTSSGKKTTDVYKNAKVVVAGHFGGKGGSTTEENTLTESTIDGSTFAEFEQEETTTSEIETAKKEEAEKAAVEETEESDEEERTEISSVKYNSMLEDEIQSLRKEYTDETGLEANGLQVQVFKSQAKEELDKKYVVK